MNRDPRWLRAALVLQSLMLRLYPKAFRERFGAEMRQTLRDRLRELPAKPSSARALDLARLGIDSLRGCIGLYADEIAALSSRQRATALALLMLLGIAATVGGGRLSVHLADASKAAQHAYIHLALSGRADEWLDLQQAAGESLATAGDARSQALAGHLLASVSTLSPSSQERIGGVPADRFSRRAIQLEAQSLREKQSAQVARMAAQGNALIDAAFAQDEPLAIWLRYLTCRAPCSPSVLADRLLGTDPGNGYFQLLKAVAASDSDTVYHALEQVGRATRYSSPHISMLRIYRDTYGAVPIPSWLQETQFFGELDGPTALAISAWAQTPFPPLRMIVARCKPETLAGHSRWEDACRAALVVLSENASETAELLIAWEMRARLDGKGSAAHREYRMMRWLLDQHSRRQRVLGEIASVLAGKREVDWLTRLRQLPEHQNGPPASYDDRLWPQAIALR